MSMFALHRRIDQCLFTDIQCYSRDFRNVLCTNGYLVSFRILEGYWMYGYSFSRARLDLQIDVIAVDCASVEVTLLDTGNCGSFLQ